MRRIKHILQFCFCLFLTINIQAKSYRIAQLSTNEGLSQQDIECMLQDKFGYIWIGSYDGLNRYDGNQLTIFRHIPNDKNSISDNRIQSIAEWSSRDEIWIGTEGRGICCYRQKDGKFISFENDDTGGKGVVGSLHQYGDAMWVGSLGGLSKITFDANNKMKTEFFPLKNVGDNQHVMSISHDSKGNIIVGTWNGIYSKSPNESSFQQQTSGVGVRRILNDKQGNLWVLTEQEAHYYSVSQQQIKSYLSSPFVLDIKFNQGEQPRAITEITDRQFLLNSKSRLIWIHQKDNSFSYQNVSFSDDTFFINNEIRTTIVDNTMNIWVASAMEGVGRFDLNQKIIYRKILVDNEKDNRIIVQAMTMDRNKNIWVGTNLGCFISNGKTNNVSKIRGGEQAVFGLLSDSKGNVWSTALSDLFLYKNGQEAQRISLFDLPNFPKTITRKDGPYGLCEDEENNIIWVGFRSGILQIHHQEGKFAFKHYNKKLFTTPHLSNITKFLLDKSTNSLFIGTATSGMFLAKLSSKGDIESITKIKSGPLEDQKELHVWTIYKASNGVTYIGTDSGLKQLTTDSKGNYMIIPCARKESQLDSYKITSILEDHKSNLWLSTGMGLISYNLETNNVRKYLNSDGLLSHTLSEGACFDADNNLLYIGCIKGVNVVELSSLGVNELPPRTIIQNIKINNQPIRTGEIFNKRILLPQSLNYTDEIKLKYFENNISFDFTALHYSNPDNNQYAYKLEGFNHDWVFTGTSHTAAFTNLPAGTYRLLIKSANGDGVWETNPLKLEIEVATAPWKSNWAYILYFLVVAAALYLMYRYFREKRRIKQEVLFEQFEHQKKLEIAEVKLKYHTNITHELRTPLSLIVSPVQELVEAGYKDEFLNTRLQNIKNNSDRLLQLIGQFLDLRKVISDKYVLRVKRYRVDQHILGIKKNFEAAADQKHIVLDLYNDANLGYCWCDIEIVNKICYNLIANAIKYTPEVGQVNVYVSTNTDSTILSISVEDTGVGIAENELDSIFERFYQSPNSVGGTGIGLHLCRHLVTLHKGTIDVKSRLGEGTIFTVELPIYKEAFDADEIIGEDKTESAESILVSDDKSLNENVQGKPLILLVEDNHEFRKYVVSVLSEEFNIVEAENGAIGYDLAVSRIPDLIISDIMMPVMDGIELTKKCKEDKLTSHIPFLLLTAKDTLDSEIEGLSYGADDYITKPFNLKTLKLKVRNLIKLTQKSDDVRKEEVEASPQLNERDQAFVDEFEKIVLDNISVPDFKIEDICQIMCISRMQFHRKMSALFAQKPSQYIKEIRMKKAYELMVQKGLNITETMQEVGYSNHSHFSKLFIEVNGKSPRDIMNMKGKNSE